MALRCCDALALEGIGTDGVVTSHNAGNNARIVDTVINAGHFDDDHSTQLLPRRTSRW